MIYLTIYSITAFIIFAMCYALLEDKTRYPNDYTRFKLSLFVAVTWPILCGAGLIALLVSMVLTLGFISRSLRNKKIFPVALLLIALSLTAAGQTKPVDSVKIKKAKQDSLKANYTKERTKSLTNLINAKRRN